MANTDETAVEINTGGNVDPDINYEIDNWGDLDLDTPLLRGIYGYGFETPSPIQKKAIKPIVLGRDVIAQAQSGTGKTATFAIAALSKVDLSNNNTQILILSPTKELSLQSAKVIEGLGNMMNGLRLKTCYGGSSQENGNRFSSKNNPHIICGCTGRVFDMMRRNKLSAEHLKLVILDEADEMLSSGFIDQVYNIFRYFNDDIQVVLVSATVTDMMNSVISKIMQNPVTISVKREMLTLEGIKQYYVAVDDDQQKFLTLKDIFVNLSVSQCIIYCNSIVRVQDLYDAMKNDDYPVCQMHGNMTKEERSAFIFMELIQPPEIQGTMVRSGKSGEGQGTLSELGIYSSFLGNGDSVYHSNYIGHLLRTKPLDATEGGVASGYSVLDSPRLVKEFVPEMCSA